MNTCEDFVRFAKAREEWLRKWIDLPNGIPCANTFLRVFAAIDPVSGAWVFDDIEHFKTLGESTAEIDS